MALSKPSFGWLDYFVFTLWLLVYAFIGIYHRFRVQILNKLWFIRKKKEEHTPNEADEMEAQFFGNRGLSTFPVFCSIMASFLSAISLMGMVAEAYSFGMQFVPILITYGVGFPIVSEVYMPVFYKLRLKSVHQYLEMRFSKAVRWVASFTFCIQMLVYMSLVLYAPAVAFSQISGSPLWVALISTGLVATFYTAMGGIRAVVWTDVCQLIILTCGMTALLITCIVKVGGFSRVFSVGNAGGRLQVFDFDPSPFVRHSFWSLAFGGLGLMLSVFATNQTQIQRYLSCKSQQTARKAILLNIPFTIAFIVIQLMVGLVTYVLFAGCDPVKSGKIHIHEELLPFIVMILFAKAPSVRGLVMSVIFAAALSTVSSGVNSLSVVVLEDIIRPVHFAIHKQDISSRMKTVLSYSLSAAIGVSTVAFGFVFTLMGPRLLQAALTLFGALGGPILAIFSLGMFFPCINSKGGLVGLVLSLIVGLWLCIGAFVYPASKGKLPTVITHCDPPVNYTKTKEELPPTIYSLSYLYYSWACVFTALISGLIVSAITGFNTKTPVEANLLAWQARKLFSKIHTSFPAQWGENVVHQVDKGSGWDWRRMRRKTRKPSVDEKVELEDIE